MSHPSPHRYIAAGQLAGRDENVLRRALAQMTETEARGAMPILSLGHLARLSGAPYLYLREIVQRQTDPYTSIERPKKTGGSRPISAPDPILMDVQRVILRRAVGGLHQHPASFAYRTGRSIVMCAERHVGARWLIKLDLHDFFGQVTERQVYGSFISCGYARLVAFELARICTRASAPSRATPPHRTYSAIPAYNVRSDGRLPQGGPTSGALANAAATPLDYALQALAVRTGLVYTRYSDDLVFSTALAFDRDSAVSVIREVADAVTSNGFALHHKKTRVIPPGTRHVVLGLLVDDERVRLMPEFKRKLETHARGVAKFGLAEHSEHRGFRSMLAFIGHVDGSLAFAAGVEPNWAAKAQESWRGGLRRHGYPV